MLNFNNINRASNNLNSDKYCDNSVDGINNPVDNAIVDGTINKLLSDKVTVTKQNPTINELELKVNINSPSNSVILVETNYKRKKFVFHDQNKNYIGEFGAMEFIKYITTSITSDFLPNVNCEISRCIIEKYICTVKKECNGEITILFRDYIESPFMGNIETLIKFHNFLQNIGNDNEIKIAMNSISENESTQITSLLNKTLCLLMTHILKIIALLTNKVQHEDTCDATKIKNSLLRYSVCMMFHLSKLSKLEVSKKMAQISNLQKELTELEHKRTIIYNNIDVMQHKIEKHDGQIDILSRNMFCNSNKNISISHNASDADSNDSTEKTGSTNSVPDSMYNIYSNEDVSSQNIRDNINPDDNILIIQ